METKEKAARQEMQVYISVLQSQAFLAMKNCLRMTEKELKDSGYASNEKAAIGMFEYYSKKIDSIKKDFFKQYPDEA